MKTTNLSLQTHEETVRRSRGRQTQTLQGLHVKLQDSDDGRIMFK